MPNGGTLTICTSSFISDGNERDRLQPEDGVGRGQPRSEGPTPGRFVVVEVADDGVGMGEAVRERIFEPFFTTKPRGTGMGLAMVYGMARAHGGFVSVESEPGVGSRFRLALPSEEALPATTEQQLRTREAMLELRVLMAEDEPIVAATTRGILEQLGCTVHECSDGEQAVDVFRVTPGDFDVVLLDLSMPRLSGSGAMQQIREIDPRIPVVVMSGYVADTSVESLRAAGAAEFVAKPFTVAAMRAALSAAVAKAS
jgi:CheY-like chemotaxis protein